MAVAGLRFFYPVTLRRRNTSFVIPAAREPSKLPEILNRSELTRLFSLTRQPPDPTGRARQHSRHLVGVRRGQGKKARRVALSKRIGVGTVQREGVEMNVQVERGAKALDEGDGATLFRPEVPVPS